MHRSWKALLALALMSLGCAAPAFAGVPSVGFVDLFTFATCEHLPFVRCGLDMLHAEYPNRFIHLEEHVADTYGNDDAIARQIWYTGGSNFSPDLYFSGQINAGIKDMNCFINWLWYRPMLKEVLNANNGMSPVDIAGDFTINGQIATLSAQFHLVEPTPLNNVRAAFFLYEDDIEDGNRVWNRIERAIEYKPVTGLTDLGDYASVDATITLDPSWNPANLHAAVVLESDRDPKKVVQASDLPAFWADFACQLGYYQAGPVPWFDTGDPFAAKGDTVTFPGSIWNLRNSTDQFTLTVDQAVGWPTDFQVEGDPNWYTSLVVSLGANESKNVTIRVGTDRMRRIGTGGFSATSAATGRQQPLSFSVFNGSPPVLFVDDDGGTGYQGVDYDSTFRATLDQNNYLYEWWDVAHNHAGLGPSISDMRGFDAVVWQTAYAADSILVPRDIAALQAYLDSGGALYLNSMDFLTTVSAPTEFTNALGLASWTNDTRAVTETGAGGDPVSDGLVLPLTWPTWPDSDANRTDTVNPNSSATAILFSEHNQPNALRNTLPSTGRVVFSTIPHNTFSTSAPDPNNARTVMARIMNWLVSTGVSAVSSGPMAGRIAISAEPNPFEPQTELAFRISDAAARAPARLSVVDVAGRVVRTLTEGRLAAGLHRVPWNGIDEAGKPVASGIYFAKLQTSDGTVMSKVVRLR